MVYQINPGTDNEPDEPFFGYRLFWSKSYGGQFITAYEDGLAMAAADIEAGDETNYDALRGVEHHQRDEAWNAKADGYNYGARSLHRNVRR